MGHKIVLNEVCVKGKTVEKNYALFGFRNEMLCGSLLDDMQY